MLEQTTYRSYDSANRLIEEILGTGHRVTWKYDPLNRCIRYTLPDQSALLYAYDAAHLKRITRVDPNGQEQYHHHYTEYDLSGSPLSATLAGSAGEVRCRFDPLLRPTAIETDPFSETVPLIDGYDAVGNLLKKERTDPLGSSTLQFSYSPLYQLIRRGKRGEHPHLQLRLCGQPHCQGWSRMPLQRPQPTPLPG